MFYIKKNLYLIAALVLFVTGLTVAGQMWREHIAKQQISSPPKVSEPADTSSTQSIAVNKPEQKIEKPVVNMLSISNELIGWGLGVKTDGTPPTVPDATKRMLSEHDAFYLGEIANKEVYLTFDEGYEAGYTPEILDILKKNDVPAAFFVTGHYIKSQPELVKRMVAEGHIVGNHTVSHPSMPALANEALKKELDGLNQQFETLTGKKMSYFRPPRGEFSERTLAVTKDLGYKTIFWSIAFADWIPLKGGPEESYTTVMNRLHNGAIILLHAKSEDNTRALDKIIKGIKDKGYQFKSLDQLKR